MARNPIVFQNGTLVSNAKVEVGGTVYDVTPAQYEGSTPLSANNLNQLQTNIYDYVDEEIEETNSKIQEDITTNGPAVKCGYKIDDRDVYVKRINFGSLPNATTKNVATGINLSTYSVIKIEGYCKANANNVGFPLPFSNPSNLGYGIMVNMTNNAEISVSTGNDRSGYTGWFNVYFY